MRHQTDKARKEFQRKIAIANIQGLLKQEKIKEAIHCATIAGLTPEEFGQIVKEMDSKQQRQIREYYSRYEIWAFDKENGAPAAFDYTHDRADAMKWGKMAAKRYWRVELEKAYYKGIGDLVQTELVAAWENGEQTTK